MEIIENINPNRIEWCCLQGRIGLSELAKKDNIPPEKLKTGELTFRQLQRIGKTFGYGLLFFMEEGTPDIEEIQSPDFRTLANQGVEFNHKISKLIRNVETHRDVYLNLLDETDNEIVETDDEIEETDNESFFSGLQFSGETIEEKALEARSWLQLDGDNIRPNAKKNFKSYRKLVERQGIFIVASQGYSGQWKVENEDLEGFSIPHEKMPIVFIKKTSAKRQVFTLFHELGHLLMHTEGACLDIGQNFSTTSSATKEREANQFAGYCLLPTRLLQEIYDSIPNDEGEYRAAFNAISEKLGISIEVILLRLLNEREISQENYQNYKKLTRNENNSVATRRGGNRFRHAEPANIFGYRYVNTILSALDEQIITLSEASDYLDHIKIKEFKKLRCHAARS